MTLSQTVIDEMKHSMKTGDRLRLETMRTLRAQLMEKEIAKRGKGGLTEEDELDVLQSAIKKRRESIVMYEKGGRKDLVEQETKEIEILKTLLPPQASTAEIEQIVKKIIQEVGATSPKDFGKVMSPVMKVLKGKADGKMIQDTVKHILQSLE